MNIQRLVFLGFMMIATAVLYGQKDQDVLLRVGDQDVTVGEFRYIYEKNNGDSADYSKESLQEYLDLYTRFKLKVAEAKSMGLDTLSALNKELDGYRKQLADSYIMDKEVLSALTHELYVRKQEDVKLKHIQFNISKRASQAEKDRKRALAQEVLDKLKAGEDFATLARKYSNDKSSAKGGGDFGWLTAKLPNGFYDFESALYNLKPGVLSDLIETPLGFHIIMTSERRPARGKIKVAHILKRKDKKDPQAAKDAIDKIYQRLSSNQAKFEDLVKQSDDDKTRMRGGELPVFGIKIYNADFEDAAFGLKKDGDISAPIETKAGYHIIKRLEKPALEPYDEYAAKMQAAIKKDERYQKHREQVIEQIKQKANYKYDEVALKNYIATLDQTLYTYKWKPQAVKDATLFSFNGNEKYMVSDFAQYLKANTRFRLRYDESHPVDEVVRKFYDDFVKEKTLEYEERALLNRHPEYRSLMREYEEGILLFEISKQEVWDKASQDTVGLNQYYEQHKSEYQWKDRADIAFIEAKVGSQTMANAIYKDAPKKSIEELKEKYNKNGIETIKVTVKKLEKDSKGTEDLKWKNGYVSSQDFNAKAQKLTFRKVVGTYAAKGKTLEEARGYVIADYQEQLEKQWVEQLRKKYKVDVKKKTLKKLKK